MKGTGGKTMAPHDVPGTSVPINPHNGQIIQKINKNK
jgi:hypothetical protein